MAPGLTAGHRREQPVLPPLRERGAVKRRGRGRPRVRPEAVAGDKGRSSRTVRRCLRERRIDAAIPTKADQEPLPRFDRAAYRQRSAVERLISRPKRRRRVATRDEKRAATDRAMATVAAILPRSEVGGPRAEAGIQRAVPGR